MLTIEKVDVSSKQQVNDFVMFHHKLYQGTPQWVPPFIGDIKAMLDPQKHPFYEHSTGEFWVARREGEIVGRIGALENKPFNQWHQVKKAQFYLFDCVDDQDVANALFNRAFEWCKERGLDTVVGPKGLSAFDGYGIQIEGNDLRQMMTMMNYNFPYYQKLVEAIGFEKEVDFVSCYMSAESFHLPEKVHLISQKVQEKGKFAIKNFKNKREMVKMAWEIGKAYNNTFVNNWEYYPLTQREIKFMLDNMMVIADPNLIKIITYNDQIVGFLFAFPDISKALQRHGGRVTPWAIADFLMELKRTDWVSLNGAGVLPEFQGRGGNALMYTEMENTLHKYKFKHGELTQVAESASQMRKDLINVGGRAYKNHRVFRKKI